MTKVVNIPFRFLPQLSHPMEVREQGPEANERLPGGELCPPGLSAPWGGVAGTTTQRDGHGVGPTARRSGRPAHTVKASLGQARSAAAPPRFRVSLFV